MIKSSSPQENYPMAKSKSKHSMSFADGDEQSEGKANSRAQVKAIIIAALIEAPLLVLTLWFCPVNVKDATGAIHTEFSIHALIKGGDINMAFFLPAVIACAMIPTSIALMSIVRKSRGL
jgi:hypothetical protein